MVRRKRRAVVLSDAEVREIRAQVHRIITGKSRKDVK